MDHALAPVHRPALERFARSRMLLALDFDGTLAPIVADPDRATIRTSTRRLLRRVARAYPCAVISGRARADVLRRLDGLGILEAIGNHGGEPGGLPVSPRPDVRRWIPKLRDGLGGVAGVRIEDKGLSLAVHYRLAPARGAARVRVLQAAAGLGRTRLLGGKQVLNILPENAPHKGTALARLVARHGLEAAIYVGDDDTDEDVFALGHPDRLLGIRVGRRPGSAAPFFIRKQAEIDLLLQLLLELRRPRRHEERVKAVP
jgi:trehalose 6-phosphate phosphatase